MTQSDVVFPANGRASLIRLQDYYEFAVSGTGAYPDFVYKHVQAPLDASAELLGKLCLESMLAYRVVPKEEAKAILAEMQSSLPSARELKSRAERYPAVVVWPDKKEFDVVCMLDGIVKSRSKLPLSASAKEIGQAVLAAFDSADKKKRSARTRS
jgi:hypothetical protein